MRNIIILGTGRSGTSMVAATFRHSGVFMGDELLKATCANPFGYYEDRHINKLNNDLIRLQLGTPLLGWRIRNRIFRTVHTVSPALFMAAPRKLREIQATSAQLERICSFTQRQPFCYKDPRFSVTLPVWLPYLPENTGFVVVFRDPMRTAESMLRSAKELYDPPLPVTRNWPYLCWQRTYSRLLQFSGTSPNWIFVNYDDILDGSGTTRLSDFVGSQLDFSQIDRQTSRSSIHQWPQSRCGRDCRILYESLCERASADQTKSASLLW